MQAPGAPCAPGPPPSCAPSVVAQLLSCPVRTTARVSADEADGPQEEVKCFKLGGKKRSYNQVAVVLEHPTEAGRTLLVAQAVECSGSSSLLPEPRVSGALHYALALPPGVSGGPLRAAVYLVYSEPAGSSPSGAEARAEAQDCPTHPAKPVGHGWLWNCLSRAHCCKGCDPAAPLLAGIQRLSRISSTGEPEAGSSMMKGRVKDRAHLYISIDEPSAHVAPGPQGTRRFRLLLAVWAPATDACALVPAPLGCALSPVIRVVANNDAPGGTAAMTLRVTMPADWEGWQAAPSAAMAQEAGGQTLPLPLLLPRAHRAPLLDVSSNQATLRSAAAANPPQEARTEPGVDAVHMLLSLGTAGGEAAACAQQTEPMPTPMEVDAQGQAETEAHGRDVPAGMREAALADVAPLPAAPVPAPARTASTPNAEEGAEALAALTHGRGARSKQLPRVRLVFTQDSASGGRGSARMGGQRTAGIAGGGGAAVAAALEAAAPARAPAPPPAAARGAGGGDGGAYVRKDHSLRALCQNFFQLFGVGSAPVSIAAAAATLGVKARRIYDVMNVLETLGAVSRHGRGEYLFLGWEALPEALLRLSSDAAECEAGDPSPAPSQQPLDESSVFAALQAASRAVGPGSDSTLSGITRRFVRVFLDAPGDTNRHDATLGALLGQGDRASRRLYDVANVLCAISLVRKVGCARYRWLGPGAVTAAFAPPAPPAPNALAAARTVAATNLPVAPASSKRPRGLRARPSAEGVAKRLCTATPITVMVLGGDALATPLTVADAVASPLLLTQLSAQRV